MTARPLTLSEVADLLRYDGKDRERSVRRLFRKYGVSIIRRDRNTFLVLPNQYKALMEAMTCSPSEDAVAFGTVEVQSVSARPSGRSKNTLRAAINARMPKPIGPTSNTNYSKKLFTAVPGGRAR